MSQYLISTSETYRVDTEEEAEQLIQHNKQTKLGQLIKYNSIHKEQKSKGEVIQSWYRVTLTKVFNDEKDPESGASVHYETKENEGYDYE